MEIRDKNVLVAGMARSGVAAAVCLLERGARVSVYDRKTEAELGAALEPLEGSAALRYLGPEAHPPVESFDLLVTSPGIPLTAPLLAQAQGSGVEVIGELELGARLCSAPICAITGTNGKTTTTTLVGEIIKNAGRLCYVVGNIGFPFTACVGQVTKNDVVAAEVSSFQLETTASFHPQVAAVLNVTEDHLNRHGTMEEYIRLKTRIFERQTPQDFTVLNLDNPITAAMADKTPGQVAFFSRKTEVGLGACVMDGAITFIKDGAPRRVVAVDEVRIPGQHNLENALAATAMAMLMGVPAPVVRHTLKTFAGVEHRIETVRTLEDITYINDSKGTNVDASNQAVRAMQQGTVLIAGGYDKHTDFGPFAQEIKQSAIHTVVLIGQTAGQIEDALTKAGFSSVRRAESLHEAVQVARAAAKPGENVLLSPACASFDQFSDYEARGRCFKEIVFSLR